MDVVRQADGIAVRVANDLDTERRQPIGSRNAVYRRRRLLDGCDIPQGRDRRRPELAGTNRYRAKIGRAVQRAQHLDWHHAVAIQRFTSRKVDLHGLQRLDHLECRKSAGGKPGGIQRDGDGALLATHDFDLRGTLSALERGRDHSLRLQRGAAQVAIGRPQRIDDAGRRAEGKGLHQRLAGAGRQLHLAEPLVDRIEVILGVGVDVELDLDLREALARRREDMLRVRQPIESIGDRNADVAVDHRGICAGISGHDENAREVDGGKELLVEPENAEDPSSHQNDGEQDDDRPVTQAPGDDASHAPLLSCTTSEPPSLDE